MSKNHRFRVVVEAHGFRLVLEVDRRKWRVRVLALAFVVLVAVALLILGAGARVVVPW